MPIRPYPGKSFYYREHRGYGGEVDHAELLTRLASTYDAWALSTSAEALQDVLAVAPRGSRVAAWHRGHRGNARAAVPLNSWEPVIYGGDVIRRPQLDDSSDTSSAQRIDSLVYVARPRLTDPERVIGAKPATFWGWLFALLGAGPEDEFTDLFPGSGGGDRAWAVWTAP